MNPFVQQSHSAAWQRIGLTSDFPDIDLDNGDSCVTARCKAFSVPPKINGPQPETPAEVDIDQAGGEDLKNQVLVFKYKEKFHAIDHGSLFDIEDFGITLSAGITCPKHGWSFDVHSGQADRGKFKLKVWEVQLRDRDPPISTDDGEKEVWVRRKQRIG